MRASFDNLQEEGVAGRKSVYDVQCTYCWLRIARTAAHPLSAVSQIPAAKMERPVYSDTKEFIRSQAARIVQRYVKPEASGISKSTSIKRFHSAQSATAFACPTLCGCKQKKIVEKLNQLHSIGQWHLYGKSAQSTAGEILKFKFRFVAQEMCGKNWNGLFRGKTLPNQ